MLHVNDNALVGPWVCERLDMQWFPERAMTIGQSRDDGILVAGVLYEDWNGRNVVMHVASDGSARWLTRDFLWFAFHYPFEQLGVRRVTAPCRASNLKAVSFVERLGFEREAILASASRDGSDCILYRMWREECHWLGLRRAA